MNMPNERIDRYETIEVKKVTPVIGAEISGIDLSKPLDTQQSTEIMRALMENLVIFFRDQTLTIEQHMAFGRLFGDLHIHPTSNALSRELGHPEILVIYADENSKKADGDEWHSDVSSQECPPMGSILYMQECPPAGGDTLFANCYKVYEALSEPVKKLVEGLTAIHDSETSYRKYDDRPDPTKHYPRTEHPIVRTHPVTGRRSLFVNPLFTSHIPQLKPHESAAVLGMLYRHIETPEFHCRFRWQPRSIAFWDNRCALHQALFDYHPHRRRAHRVTIAGDKPFFRP